MSKVYRWCIVSLCKNTSIKNPEKVFIQVPIEKTLRHLWLQASGRDPVGFSSTSCLYVCEDHFDLSDDMENFVKWKMIGGMKKMKKGIVPHKRLLPMPEMKDREPKIRHVDPNQQTCTAGSSQSIILDPYTTVTSSDYEHVIKKEQKVEHKDASVSAKSYYRSKYVQVTPQVIDQQCSPFKPPIQSGMSLSSIKDIEGETSTKTFKPKKITYSSDTSDITSAASHSTFLPIAESSNGREDLIDGKSASELALKLTLRNINLNPKRYLGIAKQSLWIIAEIKKHTGLDDISIYITLKKIKTAHTFAELADDFGISESTAIRMFKNAVPLISPLMKELIIWPSSESIQNQLPKAFRAHYGKVESIIDCLEIEINKPTDPIKQALTWSEYKKANTVKYLISSTPDGVINFISKGYGGRTTDQTIVEDCGYLNVLRPGIVVLADRGFKNIDKLLFDRQCVLVRPPSVSSAEKLTKDEVLTTKRIASLRIHIERVIRRLREYKFLKPHACIHSKLIALTDHIVYIASGLTNLQEPLIK